MGDQKTNKPQHPPTRILKDYIETVTGFSHIYHSEGLNVTMLSETCVLGASSSAGKTSGIHIPRTREKVKGL